jgi:Tfp pilus assembly protein PilE
MRNTLKDQSGFTLIEFLVIITLLGIMVFAGCMRNSDYRERAREAEVKANIHAIQIALERYAVDSGGIYPLILYGGDRTDSFATRSSPDYMNSFTEKMQSGVSEYNGDIDVLLEYGYLVAYPRNPFQRNRDVEKYGRLLSQSSQYNLPQLNYRVNIWANHSDPVHGHSDRAQQLVERQVGGQDGNRMWDVSEGQRHAPFPIMVIPYPTPDSPGNYYDYVNPRIGFNLHSATQPKDDYLFFLLPGNFYYYATFNSPGGYSAFIDGDLTRPFQTEIIGYNLAGYGSIENLGKGVFDVYNIFGDYTDRSLGTVNNPNEYDGTICIEGDTQYVGPDGRSDGVIIVVQSGSDRKSLPKVDLLKDKVDLEPDEVLMLGSDKDQD